MIEFILTLPLPVACKRNAFAHDSARLAGIIVCVDEPVALARDLNLNIDAIEQRT